MRKLERIRAKYVTSHVHAICLEYGWLPDNGPCYNAIEFRQVMEDMGVHHMTSSLRIINQPVCKACEKFAVKG